jgi:hypothetical protein
MNKVFRIADNVVPLLQFTELVVDLGTVDGFRTFYGVSFTAHVRYCWIVTIGCDAASTASASSAVNCSVLAE